MKCVLNLASFRPPRILPLRTSSVRYFTNDFHQLSILHRFNISANFLPLRMLRLHIFHQLLKPPSLACRPADRPALLLALPRPAFFFGIFFLCSLGVALWRLGVVHVKKEEQILFNVQWSREHMKDNRSGGGGREAEPCLKKRGKY